MRVQAQKVLEKLRLSIEEEKKEAANVSSQWVGFTQLINDGDCARALLLQWVGFVQRNKRGWESKTPMIPLWFIITQVRIQVTLIRTIGIDFHQA